MRADVGADHRGQAPEELSDGAAGADPGATVVPFMHGGHGAIQLTVGQGDRPGQGMSGGDEDRELVVHAGIVGNRLRGKTTRAGRDAPPARVAANVCQRAPPGNFASCTSASPGSGWKPLAIAVGTFSVQPWVSGISPYWMPVIA